MTTRIRRILLNPKMRLRATRLVKAAVKRGELPNLKRQIVKCADCDARAVAFDHRYYAKPLEVEPVCRRHNGLRGFALDAGFVDVATGKPATAEDYLAERRPKSPRRGNCVVIAITGHSGYLRDQIIKTEWRKARTRGCRRQNREEKHDYLKAEHDYRLFYGGADTGARMRMLGFEALRANRDAEATFIKEIQKTKNVRMYRWRLAEYINKRPARHTKIGIWQRKCSHARFASK